MNSSTASEIFTDRLLEVLIRPFADVHILNLVAKATIRNEEIFNRSQYEPLADADVTSFRDTIDRWVLEFAERYAAK